VYDSSRAGQSVLYMRAILNSLGYFRDSISYHTTLNIRLQSNELDQYLRTINFEDLPGKQVKLNRIYYSLADSTVNIDSLSQNTSLPFESRLDLQRLTDSAAASALIKRGDPFAKPLMSSELSRLVDLYRNNGYLRFTQDELRIVWDTL